MNIAVQTYSGCIQCRPDTSWEREDKDLYAPDFVDGYLFSPVLFVRISKAGKCIGRKFAGRYYDAVNYGILLHAILSGGRGTGFPPAEAGNPRETYGERDISGIMDHTSVLPFPMYDRVTLESGENMFSLSGDRGDGVVREIYSTGCGSAEMIESAIENVSRFVSLRIGDIAAVELAPAAPLVLRKECTVTRISGSFCGNSLFDFNIIM